MNPLPDSHIMVSSPSNEVPHRIHKHRRSAAISGDFDVAGLGLFSPPQPISKSSRPSSRSMNSPNTQNHSFHRTLYLSSFVLLQRPASKGPRVSETENHNDKDFSNEVKQDTYHFPLRSPQNYSKSLPSTPRNILSPTRKFGGATGDVNSPIWMSPERGLSSGCYLNTPSLFMTEVTHFDSENIPDAVIDLDVIHAHSKTSCHMDTRDAMRRQQESFLASPFSNHGHNSSNLFAHTAFPKQMRELAEEAIEEEDDSEDSKRRIEVGLHGENLVTKTPETDEVTSDLDIDSLVYPPDAFGGVYQTLSASSSTSSLPSATGILRLHFLAMEKTFSNSSRDSSSIGLVGSSGQSWKRSSAKASRYQLFYDQSLKVSSALKHSSTESVPLTASDLAKSANNVIDRDCSPSRGLYHSSSLSNLKVQDSKSATRPLDQHLLRELNQLSKTYVSNLRPHPQAVPLGVSVSSSNKSRPNLSVSSPPTRKCSKHSIPEEQTELGVSRDSSRSSPRSPSLCGHDPLVAYAHGKDCAQINDKYQETAGKSFLSRYSVASPRPKTTSTQQPRSNSQQPRSNSQVTAEKAPYQVSLTDGRDSNQTEKVKKHAKKKAERLSIWFKRGAK